MVKIAIKPERLTHFGSIFSILEQFDFKLLLSFMLRTLFGDWLRILG